MCKSGRRYMCECGSKYVGECVWLCFCARVCVVCQKFTEPSSAPNTDYMTNPVGWKYPRPEAHTVDTTWSEKGRWE